MGTAKHDDRTPVPVLTVGDIGEAAIRLLDLVKGVHRARGCGCYLFVTQTGHAYLLAEDRRVAPTWIREHFDWLVAHYDTERRSASPFYLPATVEGIAEDLAEHLSVEVPQGEGRLTA